MYSGAGDDLGTIIPWLLDADISLTRIQMNHILES